MRRRCYCRCRPIINNPRAAAQRTDSIHASVFVRSSACVPPLVHHRRTLPSCGTYSALVCASCTDTAANNRAGHHLVCLWGDGCLPTEKVPRPSTELLLCPADYLAYRLSTSRSLGLHTKKYSSASPNSRRMRAAETDEHLQIRASRESNGA